MLRCLTCKCSTVYQQRQNAEMDQRSFNDHASLLQAEIETLKLELLTVSEKYRLQIMLYNERKIRTKIKLQKARYVHTVYCEL